MKRIIEAIKKERIFVENINSEHIKKIAYHRNIEMIDNLITQKTTNFVNRVTEIRSRQISTSGDKGPEKKLKPNKLVQFVKGANESIALKNQR